MSTGYALVGPRETAISGRIAHLGAPKAAISGRIAGLGALGGGR